MNPKETQKISEAIRQFRLSSVLIEKELSDWESHGGSNRDQLIFFITRLAAYKANLMSLEEAIGGSFEVDLSKITGGISQQKEVMKLLIGDESAE